MLWPWLLWSCALTMRATLFSLAAATAQVYASEHSWGIRDDLHFPLHARATNKDGSTPVYKDPDAAIEDRVNDLLPRMTVQEKVAQLIQGDINGWMNMSDPLDDTLVFNQTGLVSGTALLNACTSSGLSQRRKP